MFIDYRERNSGVYREKSSGAPEMLCDGIVKEGLKFSFIYLVQKYFLNRNSVHTNG